MGHGSKTIHELVELASIRTARDPSFLSYDLQRALVKLPEPIELPKIQKLKDAVIIHNKKVFHRTPPTLAGKENELFRVCATERDPSIERDEMMASKKWYTAKTPNYLYLKNPNVSVVEVTLNARMELTGYRKKEFGASAWVELFRPAEGLVWGNGGFVHRASLGERHGTWL